MCDGAQFTRGSFTRYHTPPLFCAQQKLGRKWQGKEVGGGGGEKLRSHNPNWSCGSFQGFLDLHNWSSHTHYCIPILTIWLHCGCVHVGTLPSFVNKLNNTRDYFHNVELWVCYLQLLKVNTAVGIFFYFWRRNFYKLVKNMLFMEKTSRIACATKGHHAPPLPPKFCIETFCE